MYKIIAKFGPILYVAAIIVTTVVLTIRDANNNLIKEGTIMIALTANAVVGARESYLEAGFDDYLSKPIELKALGEMLIKHLPEELVKYGK